jgi:uncharacterized membrane protein
MCSIPGYLLGDMRFSNLAFIGVGAAALLGARGRYAVFGAALLLTSPRIFFMIQQGWTDAYCFGLLALTVSLSARSSRMTPWLFGLTLASKHYMIFLVPLGFLLIPTPWDRKKVALFIGKAVLAGTLVTLPWILWDPHSFWKSIYVPNLPFRTTSLSFLSAMAINGIPLFVDSLPFILLIPTYTLILFCSARGASGFAMSSALVLSVFFSFAKSAYCNQHFLVLGCAAAALASARFETRSGGDPSSVSSPCKP